MSADTVAPSRKRGDPVRVVLCTSGGLNGALVMGRLCADPNVELAGLVVSSRLLRKELGWLAGALGHLRISGPSYLLYLWAATGLAEWLMGRSRLLPVRAQARWIACPVHVTRDINAPGSAAFLEACRADLLVSAFFNQRIGPHIFERPRFGAVNIHPSLLPALKGVDPLFFARLRGITPVGVTLHRVGDALDTGAILAQAPVAVAADDSLLLGNARLFERGAQLLSETLERIVEADPGQPQDPLDDYDSWPTASQVRHYRQRGFRLVRRNDLQRLRSGKLSDC